MSNGKRRFPARSEAESSEPSEDRTGASVAETPESSALAHPGGNGKRRLAARSEAEPSGDRTGASVTGTPGSSACVHPGGNAKRRFVARSSDLGALAAPPVPRT
jgi:hypothetical protein